MSLSDLLPFLTGGGGAIVAMSIGYWLLLSGRFVLRSEHRRLLRDYDKVAQANDTLVASLDACRETNSQLRATNAQLLNTGELTTRVLDAFTAVAQQRGASPVVRPAEGGG